MICETWRNNAKHLLQKLLKMRKLSWTALLKLSSKSLNIVNNTVTTAHLLQVVRACQGNHIEMPQQAIVARALHLITELRKHQNSTFQVTRRRKGIHGMQVFEILIPACRYLKFKYLHASGWFFWKGSKVEKKSERPLCQCCRKLDRKSKKYARLTPGWSRQSGPPVVLFCPALLKLSLSLPGLTSTVAAAVAAVTVQSGPVGHWPYPHCSVSRVKGFQPTFPIQNAKLRVKTLF